MIHAPAMTTVRHRSASFVVFKQLVIPWREDERDEEEEKIKKISV
jgi:hypothetical protein